jgi:hypothetical protein
LDARSVILLLRKSSILLFKGSNACFHPSIYVDAHGETDENLRRGKPLFLNARRYAAMEAMWATRGVSATVARTRNSSDMIIRDGYF